MKIPEIKGLTAGDRLFAGVYLKFLALVLILEAIVRIVLLCNISAPEGACFGILDYLQAFGMGAVNDACLATVAFLPMWLFCVTTTPRKFGKTAGAVIVGVLALTLIYIYFFDKRLHEFNGPLTRIICILLMVWIATFLIRFLVLKIRKRWMQTAFALMLCVYVALTVFNCVAEYFFWAEFNVRYNFIAVDYLVYTQEVIGNIFESYSMTPIIGSVVAVSAAIMWFIFRKDIRNATDFREEKWKLRCSIVYLPLTAIAAMLLGFNTRFQETDNTYLNELQANGVYKFYQAFLANQLEFGKFYQTLPDEEADAIIAGIYGTIPRMVSAPDSVAESRRNVILITIESLSADYMERYGNDRHLTPSLDTLAAHSLTFDRAFATGNRTVRGLEAVTLSLPPSPGQSIVKREKNVYPSVADVFRSKGYDTYYFYGGNAYFDNMESFFGGNGYTIVDRKSYTPDEVSLETIWGVCDEDGFDKVVSTLDKRFAKTDKPVFAHVMTISNHRPFIYPEGKVSIPSAKKKRDGGVQYTDYAVGRFVTEARKHKWGRDAIFVIVADHCASSAGLTDLPPGNYHIPAMIYSPGFIEPRAVDKTVSQIDLMPTLFALMGFDYKSDFYGFNVLDSNYSPRAFMATYQDLGYLEGDTLTVLSPLNRIRQYAIRPTAEDAFHAEPAEKISEGAARRATALYQKSSATH